MDPLSPASASASQVRFRPLQTHAWSGQVELRPTSPPSRAPSPTETRARATAHYSCSAPAPSRAAQVLSLPESSVSDVLRYRSASTRFDLLLRGQQLERLLAVFAHAGMPVGTAPGLQPQQLVPTGSDAYLEPALPFGLLAPAPTAIGHISPQTEPSPHTSPLGHLSPQPLGHGSPPPLGQSSPPLLGHASPLGHLSPQPPAHRSPPGHGSPPGLEPQPLSAGLVMPGPLGGHLQTAGQPHAPPTEQRCAPSSLLTPTQLLGPGHGPSPAEQTMLRVSTALEALGLHNPPPGTRAQAEPHDAPSRRPL